MRDLEEALRASENWLSFETLLAEISGRFVNLPADQVDQEIIGAQRRVCEFLGLDLSLRSGSGPRQTPVSSPCTELLGS